MRPGYDLVLNDDPPNLGLLTVNVCCAVLEVMVVDSMTDRNAYKCAMALLATVNALRRNRVDVAVTGVVRTNVGYHRSTYRLLNDALIDGGYHSSTLRSRCARTSKAPSPPVSRC